MSDSTVSQGVLAIGIDLGVHSSHVCVARGDEILNEFKIGKTRESVRVHFEKLERCPVLVEACGVSAWVSGALKSMGFEVKVCVPTTLSTTSSARRKSDRTDARALANLCSNYPKILSLVQHAPEEMQRAIALLRIRDSAVKSRSLLVNSVRGISRSLGTVLEKYSTEAFPAHARTQLPPEVAEIASKALDLIEQSTKAIAAMEKQLETISASFPATKVVQQVQGVGPITALAFVTAVHDPSRFPNTRAIGSYFGLAPLQYQSGESDPQLRISKEGQKYLRYLLVQCAHYILGHKSADSDLRRFGLEMAESGGPRGKKRAVVAMARRLAVSLLSLWKTGEVYEPLRNTYLRLAQQNDAAA